jgi:glycine betaine/proline transport system ATP-binding protein
LSRIGENETNGAFVVDDDSHLLGVVTDERLLTAINAGETDLTAAVGQELHTVGPDAVVGEFMHLAGRQVVPVTVVDDRRRLVGVVPRATILSSLSHVKEVSHV